MTTSLPVTPSAAPGRSTRRWLALCTLALAEFLVVLDASIVNIALPVLGDELAMDAVALRWVITAYVLAFGGLLLLGGRLADRFGHRRIFLAGTAGFTLSSTAAGLSFAMPSLLAARALQGLSAALLAPAALALVTHLFPEGRERGKALGIWGAVAGVASAAGVLLGGVLTAAFGWRSVFFVNVPIGALVLITIPILITRDAPDPNGKLDVRGSTAITGALVAAVAALSAVEQVGFTHALSIGFAAVAAILGLVFIYIERRTPTPLVPLMVFRNRNLTIGNIVILLLGAAMVALFFALSVYLQTVLHYGALTAGLSQLPLAGALIAVAGAVPAIVVRAGIRSTLSAALTVLAAGLVWLSFAPVEANYAVHILGPTLLIGLGLGAAFVTATQLSVDGVDGGEAGLAGGLVNTSQQIGGALGLAALGAVAALRTEALVNGGFPGPDAVTGGFSWLFLGAAAASLAAAAAARLARTR